MKNLILILLFFISFNSFGNSYLGKSSTEILKMAKSNSSAVTMEIVNEKHAFIKINDGTATTYLNLVDDVCKEVVIAKKDEDNSLSKDLEAFDNDFNAVEFNKWISKDLTKVYHLTVQEGYYNLSIIVNDRVFHVAPKSR